MALDLTGSVGKGGQNASRDVRAVKERLGELGFQFFRINSVSDQGLVLSIRLFQSIIAGRSTLGGDGRIDVGYTTNRYLDAVNAPRWTTMPFDGPGFTNFEANDPNDQHDFGTDWLGDTIRDLGASYRTAYLLANPDAALLTVNDVSLPEGGDTPDHAGHETGLSCDLRLPRKDGGSGGISNPNTNGAYDRDAMRAQLVALKDHDLVTKVFFNDRILIGEGLCKPLAGHNNHVHFEIGAPGAVLT
jgi:hypothetical protein